MIGTVGVVGLGPMGSGIAELCARSGLDVRAVEQSEQAVDIGLSRLRVSVMRAVVSGTLDHVEAEAILERVAATTDCAELSDVDLVIEAATEDEPVKLAIFRALDEAVRPESLLVTTTSSISIAHLASATKRADRVMGMHFFSPVPTHPLVELVPSLITSSETIAMVDRLAWGPLGKNVIYAKDRAGFVVNALLVPYLLSAVRMLESGFATREDIDAGMVQGCGHSIGPLAMLDLIGLDRAKILADVLFAENGEPHFAAPQLLTRMVEAGLTGRTVGRGFFDYPEVRGKRVQAESMIDSISVDICV
ncbi:MAG: 3-hydroxybutyryl-CoA dehydrogenase [Subtercola sp.]|nr:3-hydroxybutyryl-CoA dehydrogenase [Subtercola sp.]